MTTSQTRRVLRGRPSKGRTALWAALALACQPVFTTVSASAQAASAAPTAPMVAAAPALPGRSLLDAASQIETLLVRGQSDEAVAAARQFMRLVTERAGFGVTSARLTAAPAEGYGMYTPRPDNIYRTGEPVYAYVEVYGFTMTSQSDGENRMLFDVSFTLDSPDGRQMTDAMIPMGEVRLDSYSEPVDGYFHLTYRVTGANGPYSLRTEVIDRVSGQRAVFLLPVEFVDPGTQTGGKQVTTD